METVAETGMSFAERLSMSGQMTLLGLGTIFLVLALLWGAMVIFKLLLHDLPARRSKAKEDPGTAETAASVEPEAIQPSEDAQLVAVITAAIAAFRTQEGIPPTEGFRVVSFKRTHH